MDIDDKIDQALNEMVEKFPEENEYITKKINTCPYPNTFDLHNAFRAMYWAGFTRGMVKGLKNENTL